MPDTLFAPNEGCRIVRDLRADGVDSRLVLFGGGHTLTETPAPDEQVTEIESMVIEWFDEHVRGDGDTDAGVAPLTYWDVQRGEFREADGFPPSDATIVEPTLADLEGDGTSVVVNSGAPTSTNHFSPENTDAAPVSVATFDLEVGDDLEVLGVPELSLSVTPLGARAFLFGKVYHVADGEATLINSQVAPVAVEGTPGESRQVAFELVGFQRRFAAGDTLRVALASTDAGFASARRGADVAIDHAGSTLSLPVVGDGDGDGRGNVDIAASADATVLTGGASTEQDVTVDGGPTFIRDRTPEGWVVADADRPYTRMAPPETAANYVEFRRPVADETASYVARAPTGATETAVYRFGPVEASDDGTDWRAVEGTDRTVLLVGADV